MNRGTEAIREGAKLDVRNKVFIKLTPTCIEVSAPTSGGELCLSKRHDLEAWEQAWSDQLHPLDEALQTLVTKAGVQGARAIVIYESPTAFAEVQSNCAVNKGALLAAKLALRDGASFNLDSDPSAFVEIARDNTGEPKRTHVLSAVDTECSTRVLVEFIERSGLHVDSLTPALAQTLSGSVRTALDVCTQAPTAVLWMDGHHAVFAVASAGRIHYVRSIDLGIERLMEAMTRHILRKETPHDGGVALTMEEARDIFQRVGVPKYDQIVDEARGIHGSDLLPLIQPVLQRLIVEIKQSIRFGVPDSLRKNIRLLLMGPGALIPGLAGVIACEANLDLNDPSKAIRDTSERSQNGLDEAVTLAKTINLLPPSAVAVRLTHRLRTGMIAGAVVGLVLLAADAGWTTWASRALEARTEVLEPIAQQVQLRQKEYDNATVKLSQVQQMIEKITQRMTDRANWSSWLAELSRLTPLEIRLTRLSGLYDQGEPYAEITGVVNGGSAEQTRDLITNFLESLRSCTLVDSVELGSVARSGAKNTVSHEFRIAVRLVAVPATDGIEEEGL